LRPRADEQEGASLDRGQAHALRGRPREAATGLRDLLDPWRLWDETPRNAFPSARDGPVIDGQNGSVAPEDQAPEALISVYSSARNAHQTKPGMGFANSSGW